MEEPNNESSNEKTNQAPNPSAEAKKKKTSKKSSKIIKAVQPEVEQAEPPPKDIVPLFLATKTQEIFQCIAGNDVTEESPYKLINKEDILKDMITRAAISDFHPVKQMVQDYSGEELLVVYDANFNYGQNFYICITEEAKNRLTKPSVEETAKEENENDEDSQSFVEDISEIEDETVYTYKPPVAKEWISLGSHADVDHERVVNSRPLIHFLASRIRKEFGSPCSFTDRNADASKTGSLSSSYVSCNSYNDNNFSIKRLELERAVQAVPKLSTSFSQTEWKHPVSTSTQYEARAFTEQEANAVEESESYQNFVVSSLPRFQLALQQNEITNPFVIDWEELGEEVSNFGVKSDTHLKEYQSFTDLEFSKDKTISYTDWHPEIKGIVAVSCCERLSTYERIEQANRLIMTPSLILIWSFIDPIHPQILLEAPDDVMCFQFCPTNPNIIAAGCINGQLVLWDISEYEDKLSNAKTNIQSASKNMAMFGEQQAPETPTVRYCAVSSIENSHKRVITYLSWIPDHFELNRFGVPHKNSTSECNQLISCGGDGVIMIWDIRPPKSNVKEITEAVPMGVSNTFKYLDLTWKPLMKLVFDKPDSSGGYTPTYISLAETQGVSEHVAADLSADEQIASNPKSPKKAQPLPNIQTKFFFGTEDGELVYADLKVDMDSESGKFNGPHPEWQISCHDGPIKVIHRNPFFHDILLSVGGWTFSLHKEGIEESLLTSVCGCKFYTGGRWSPTRASVFYLATQEGDLEVWDLLDRTHEPIFRQNITSAEITQVIPTIVTKRQHLLAVTDNIGTLHILEIPWNLHHPASNEKSSLKEYIDREVSRIEYFKNRSNKPRKGFKDQIKSETNVVHDEDDMMEIYKQDFDSYKALEKKLLIQLGVLKEEVETEESALA